MDLTALMWRVWAKTDRDAPERWHALPWHLLAVGAVAQELWRHGIPTYNQRRLAQVLGVDGELLWRWIGFLAAVHDLGKLTAWFVGQVDEQRQRLLVEFGDILAFPSYVNRQKNQLPHGYASIYLLTEMFERKLRIVPEVAVRYALVTGAHHGVFPDSALRGALRSRSNDLGKGIWSEAREELFEWLRRAFDITDPFPAAFISTPLSYPDALWLAGLISFADWIGSDEKGFPFRVDVMPPAQAIVDMRMAAKRALQQTGWLTPPLAISAESFVSAIRTLPGKATPTAAQLIAVDAIRGMGAPGIAIVELPTGSGKSELAFCAAAYWAERFGFEGCYFAMPTMATSDQLHERVVKHFGKHLGERADPINLQLLHGQAVLSTRPEISAAGVERELLEQARRLSNEQSVDDEPPEARIQRIAWFTRRKRGLLARYGVGTVDQAMLSVLRSRHFFVRIHGLAGKTVVFDEVHSYDVYMSGIFDELLAWLGALGSPVVILSATLPKHRTTEMLTAYARGAGWSLGDTELAPYPRISVCDDAGMRSFATRGQHEKPERIVRVEWMPGPTDIDQPDLWKMIGVRLDAALADGGVAALICNTVRQARAAYGVLKKWFPPEQDQLTLFHARFRQKDRAEIQDKVLKRFGKYAGDCRPPRHIVIATQVIEQSLDLDFDLLVSMFCPTDLLLQRIGRAQRHRSLDARRPPRLRGNPTVWITGYELDGAIPHFAKGTHIYSRFVLLRSWSALRGRDQIVVPDDVASLVESTYSRGVKSSEDLTEHIADAWQSFEYKRRKDAEAARNVQIPSPDADDLAGRLEILEYLDMSLKEPEDGPLLHASALARTRLGPPSVDIVVLTSADQVELAAAISSERTHGLNLDEVRGLLACAVALSDGRAVEAHPTARFPPIWEKSPFLRHHRLVLVNDQGFGFLGDVPIALDKALGVCVDRDEEKGEGEP